MFWLKYSFVENKFQVKPNIPWHLVKGFQVVEVLEVMELTWI
jgi:hypothetical protein